jgi:purine-cytosine permease-like protein
MRAIGHWGFRIVYIVKHFECIGWTQPMEVSFADYLPWTMMYVYVLKAWLLQYIKLMLHPRNKKQ